MSLKTIYWEIHLRVKLLDWGKEGHRSEAEIASLRAAFTQEVVVWHKLDHSNVTKESHFFYPPNSTLHLYGGAAFERVIHEFRCAAYSIECPPVSREKVANILLAHAGRGGARGITEAAAKIARFAARSWLAPLFDTVCDRLGFVLGNLFDLALERNRSNDSEYGSKTANMDDCVGFHAALRCAYSRFIKDLSKQCKQLIRHHLDSVTSPFLQLDVLLVFLDVYMLYMN